MVSWLDLVFCIFFLKLKRCSEIVGNGISDTLNFKNFSGGMARPQTLSFGAPSPLGTFFVFVHLQNLTLRTCYVQHFFILSNVHVTAFFTEWKPAANRQNFKSWPICLYFPLDLAANAISLCGFLVSEETLVLPQWQSENKYLVSSNQLIKV